MSEIKCLKCGRVLNTLQGWKRHMSGVHGGYDQMDLEATVGGAPVDDVKSRMAAFAATLPMGESEPGSAGESAHPSEPSTTTTTPPIQPAEKRVKATPKKFKKLIGSLPAKVLEINGIEMDEDDEQVLDEAAEFLADIFGVEFSVPESKYLIQSRFLAFVWVAGITMLIYLKHKFPQVWEAINHERKDEKSKPLVN